MHELSTTRSAYSATDVSAVAFASLCIANMYYLAQTIIIVDAMSTALAKSVQSDQLSEGLPQKCYTLILSS